MRKAQGLTLRQVADLSHINIGQLSRVERGQASLSIGALVRLASVLGMQPLAATLSQYVPEDGEGGPENKATGGNRSQRKEQGA